MIVFCYILILAYGFIITILIYGFDKIKSFESIDLPPKTKFTIIVPFRNEAENIPILLDSFSKLNYPSHLFEVILVDDDSEEAFDIMRSSFSIQTIKNIRISNSPKKDAITTAISLTTSEWIITTDADCVVKENWLLTLDNYIQNQEPSMIVGAVTYTCEESFLHHFQQLDLASLQGATIGSFGINKGFLCNGANFAYTKSLFNDLNGFDGNNKIASGDDVFLLQKARMQFPEKVHYLKSENNIVITKPLNNWKNLFHQRVRWASKTASYQSKFGIGLGLIVFGGNMSWVLSIWFWIMGLIPFQTIILVFLLKFSIDTLLIYKANRFLTKNRMQHLVLGSLFYPFFNLSVALYSLYGKYEWKGRQF